MTSAGEAAAKQRPSARGASGRRRSGADRRRGFAAVLAFALGGLSAPVVHAACEPQVDYSVAGEFRDTPYVFSARVIRETWLDEHGRPTKLRKPLTFGDMPGGFDPYLGALYRMRLTNGFKGHLPPVVNVLSENSTARTPMIVGKEYLLFARWIKGDSVFPHAAMLMADKCGNSGIVTRRRKEVSQLRVVLAQHRATLR